MPNIPRILVLGTIAATFAASLPDVAAQDAFPTRVITVVVPYAAGGGVDLMMRQIAQKVEQSGKMKIVIENRPGAGGTIASQQVARTAPDGYTLIEIDATTHSASPYLVKRLPYDPIKDFQPITLFYYAPPLLFVNAKLPISSVNDVAELAKRRQGGLSYATQGLGTNGHLLGALLARELKAPLIAVPYNNSSLLRQDLASGRVDMIFSVYGTMLGELAAGTVKPIAVASPERLKVRPDVPTMVEAGFPSIQSSSWWGIAGPAGMDRKVVAFLNSVFVEAVNSPEVSARMSAQGMRPAPMKPEEFSGVIKRSISSVGELMKEAGVTPR